MKTGYGVETLKKRLDDLIAEVKLMGEDGRLSLEDSILVMTHLQRGLDQIYEVRLRER